MNRFYDTRKDILGRLGMIVPVYYPADVPVRDAAGLLRQTLADTDLYCSPEHVVLVVDGQEKLFEVAERVGRESSPESPFRVLRRSENQGKGAAVRWGMEYLLAETDCDSMVVRDNDGDHYANDIPSLFRLLHQMREESASDLAVAIGARADRRRPMGLGRGELEVWIVDFFWQAARWALAAQCRAPNETFLGPYGPVPDVLSGFKMYTRGAAFLAVEGMAHAMDRFPELDMGHYGCEIVPPAEVLLAGGLLGQMVRGTLQGQPCSGFAAFDPLKMYPKRLIWISRRFELSGEAACQLFDNACARSPLSADEDMVKLFAEARKLLADALGVDPGPSTISAFC